MKSPFGKWTSRSSEMQSPRAEVWLRNMRRLTWLGVFVFVSALSGCSHTVAGAARNDCRRSPLAGAQMTKYRSLAEDRFRLVPDRRAQARLRGRNFVAATDSEAALLDSRPLNGAYYYLVRSAYLTPADRRSQVSVPKYMIGYNRDDQSILVESYHISTDEARAFESVLVVSLPFKLRARYVACATAF